MSQPEGRREILVSQDGRIFEIFDEKIFVEYKGKPPINPTRFIDRAAYDELLKERDAALKEVQSYKKAKAENDERFQLEAGELKAEVERLRGEVAKPYIPDLRLAQKLQQAEAETKRLKDTPGGKRLYSLFNELTKEREINAMLREALEYVQLVHVEKLEKIIRGQELSGWALEHNAKHAREALNREQDMRKNETK